MGLLDNVMYKPNNGLLNMINQETGGYGTRPDGSSKGRGYFGELVSGDGISTEISAEETLRNGKNLMYPLLSPNQSFKDLSNLLTGGKPTNEMYDAAVRNALSRQLTGRSPFAELGEENSYTGWR